MAGNQGKHSRENGKLGGRPLGTATLIRQKFREALAKKIDAEAEDWLTAIRDSALGHYVQLQRKDGTVKVYKKSPDPAAWREAMDRAFGKAEQSVDVTSGGKPLILPSEVISRYNLEDGKNKQNV